MEKEENQNIKENNIDQEKNQTTDPQSNLEDIEVKKDTEEQIQELIKSLKIRRYCCRMRLLTTVDLVKDILPIDN